MLGDPVIDPVTGQPQTRLEEGVPMIVRGPALVETGAGGAVGMARSSRLAEILFGETLKAGGDARTAHPTPPSTAPDHATPAQRRRAAAASPSGWISVASTSTTRSTAACARS